MWMVRKRPRDLGEREKETLGRLFAKSPVLLAAYLYGCALTEIFDGPLRRPMRKSN
jgi:hypothetical protein